MRQTSNQSITVFVIAVGLALAVIGATTAAGAFARSSKPTVAADQPVYSATFVKLSTGVTIEDVLY